MRSAAKLRAHVFNAARLGQGDEGQATGAETRMSRSCCQYAWVMSWMRAATPVVAVVVAHDNGGGHLCMFALGTGMRAVFAVAGD